jgi:hypothetical protein
MISRSSPPENRPMGKMGKMRKILSLLVCQQIPMCGFRGAVHAWPFSFRFRQRIVAAGAFFHQTGTVQNSGVFPPACGNVIPQLTGCPMESLPIDTRASSQNPSRFCKSRSFAFSPAQSQSVGIGQGQPPHSFCTSRISLGLIQRSAGLRRALPRTCANPR